MRMLRTETGIILESDSGQSMPLSVEELGQLLRNAQNIFDQLGSSGGGGFQPVQSAPAEEIVVSIDAHHAMIVLRLVSGANDVGYAISPDTAQKLRDSIDRKLAVIQTTTRTAQ